MQKVSEYWTQELPWRKETTTNLNDLDLPSVPGWGEFASYQAQRDPHYGGLAATEDTYIHYSKGLFTRSRENLGDLFIHFWGIDEAYGGYPLEITVSRRLKGKDWDIFTTHLRVRDVKKGIQDFVRSWSKKVDLAYRNDSWEEFLPKKKANEIFLEDLEYALLVILKKVEKADDIHLQDLFQNIHYQALFTRMGLKVKSRLSSFELQTALKSLDNKGWIREEEINGSNAHHGDWTAWVLTLTTSGNLKLYQYIQSLKTRVARSNWQRRSTKNLRDVNLPHAQGWTGSASFDLEKDTQQIQNLYVQYSRNLGNRQQSFGEITIHFSDIDSAQAGGPVEVIVTRKNKGRFWEISRQYPRTRDLGMYIINHLRSWDQLIQRASMNNDWTYFLNPRHAFSEITQQVTSRYLRKKENPCTK